MQSFNLTQKPLISLCVYIYIYIYSKTCLKRNLTGPEYFSAKAKFPFNQGTLHIKIKPRHACI